MYYYYFLFIFKFPSILHHFPLSFIKSKFILSVLHVLHVCQILSNFNYIITCLPSLLILYLYFIFYQSYRVPFMLWTQDTQNIDNSIAGTLADLKKHRLLSSKLRSSTSPENGSIGVQSMPPIELSVVSTPDLQSPIKSSAMPKFSGITGDVVSDSTRSRKCCNLM